MDEQPQGTPHVTAAARYEQLETDRMPYLERAYEVSELTLPFIMPREGTSASTTLPIPHQGFGARCITNLADKTLMALFPTTRPFFRNQASAETRAAMDEMEEDEKSAVLSAMSTRDQRVSADFEQSNIRATSKLALIHLFISGNGVVHETAKGKYRFFGLNKFVCIRDGDGDVVEAIIKETHKVVSMPPKVKAAFAAGGNAGDDPKQDGCVYTHMVLEDGTWSVKQECNGVVVEDSAGTYAEGDLPFMFIRDIPIDGEHYGRSRGELYIGDFYAVEKLSEAMLDGAALSSRVWLGVKPGAVCKVADLNKARNGQAVTANPDDVFEITFSKGGTDREVVRVSLNEIKQLLAQAFLLNSSVTRQAERVTAEEIRWLVQELEEVQAGLYATLAQDFQGRLVHLRTLRLVRAKAIPKLPKGATEPVLVTGLDALGKGYDLQKITTFVSVLNGLPDEAKATVKWVNITTDIADTIGFADPKRYVMTDAEVQDQKRRQMAEAAMAQGAMSGAEVAGQSMGAEMVAPDEDQQIAA